jgi:hypothetical protein
LVCCEGHLDVLIAGEGATRQSLYLKPEKILGELQTVGVAMSYVRCEQSSGATQVPDDLERRKVAMRSSNTTEVLYRR